MFLWFQDTLYPFIDITRCNMLECDCGVTSMCTKSQWRFRHVTGDIWLSANKPRSETERVSRSRLEFRMHSMPTTDRGPWPRRELTWQEFSIVFSSACSLRNKKIKTTFFRNDAMFGIFFMIFEGITANYNRTCAEFLPHYRHAIFTKSSSPTLFAMWSGNWDNCSLRVCNGSFTTSYGNTSVSRREKNRASPRKSKDVFPGFFPRGYDSNIFQN